MTKPQDPLYTIIGEEIKNLQERLESFKKTIEELMRTTHEWEEIPTPRSFPTSGPDEMRPIYPIEMKKKEM